MTPILDTKLPNVGTTIFTVMSALATEHQAVNLGQGFPDFGCDPALIDAVSDAMREGLNQYPSMLGVLELRQAEVIVLEPCYDSYIPNIELAGGTVVRVPLTPGSFRPDFDRISAAITPRTRAMLINSPHNPSATVWSDADMLRLQEILAPTQVLLISDEVYEHMVYAPLVHRSAASYPGLAERAFIISSFGKTYHVTGWKVAYCAAPPSLTAEFRKVHQFNVFTVNTPVQHGLARFMERTEPYMGLPAFYARKRDLFRAGLERTAFKLLPSEGSYFQCVRIDELKVAEKNLSESDFCQWLTREVGVAAIPLSAFYADGFDQRVIRFCFAKKDETLNLALERLARL